MQFYNILKNKKILKILNKTLTSPKNKEYNQYSLFTVIDFIIKYQIIIEDEQYDEDLVTKLEQIITNYQTHQELILSLNNLLVNLICKKLNIKDKEDNNNKKEIIKYVYDKYIVNGYFFHSFPSSIKKQIEENGLTQEIEIIQNNNLKQINHIFNNHNYKDIANKNLDTKTSAIHITDSPALAYYHANNTPSALGEITASSKYYKYLKTSYDKEAFYKKDYQACKGNVLKLSKHLNMTEKEKKTVMEALTKEWQKLDLINSKPTIAFIKRSALSKNSLKDIEKTIELSEQEDIIFTIARITDSKYRVLRRYTSIDKEDIKIYTLPSYNEIINYKEEETVILNLSSHKKLEEEEIEVNIATNNLSYSYGRANIVALLGALLISLGLTISIILKVIGG